MLGSAAVEVPIETYLSRKSKDYFLIRMGMWRSFIKLRTTTTENLIRQRLGLTIGSIIFYFSLPSAKLLQYNIISPSVVVNLRQQLAERGSCVQLDRFTCINRMLKSTSGKRFIKFMRALIGRFMLE